MNNKGKLIIFSAPSGSGKTTIVRKMLENDDFRLKFSVSATSRKKRNNEIDGKDYYFISADEFRQKIKNNEFIEYEEVYKNQFYGTLKSEVDRIINNNNNVIFDIDVVGGLNIKKQFGDIALTVFIKPPSIDELENRLRKRGTEDEKSISKRLAKAEHELTYATQFDKIIVNDDLQIAYNETEKILYDFCLE